MTILCQRWEYRIGNSVVMVDNGFNWLLWGQERLAVNEETVQCADGWGGFYRAFAEPWLTRIDESELRIVLRSRLDGIACAATLDGVPIEPEAHWSATWGGPRGSWPGEGDWTEAPARSWIAR